MASALTGGYHLVFAIGAGLMVAAIALAATVLRPKAPARPERLAASEPPAADRDSSEAA